MKIQRIYIDTSVIGGCFDREFAPWSNGLVKDIRLGHFQCVISEIVSAEIEDAPAIVRQKYNEIRVLGAEELFLIEDVEGLLNSYRKHRILADKFRNDMLHIAFATFAQVDILVSWNFTHIVHFDKIRRFNAVNIEQGYQPIAIHSPREVTNYVEH